MPIELVFPENPEWNPTLNAKNLIPEDYVNFTVDKFWKEIPPKNPEYGPSYMYFVTVFEYSYFDAKQRKVIDKSYPEGQQATYFASQRLNRNMEKYVGQAVQLKAVETKGGKTAYNVSLLNTQSKESQNSSDDEITVKNPDLPNQGGGDDPELKKLVDEFKKAGFDEVGVVNALKATFPEDSIRAIYKLE